MRFSFYGHMVCFVNCHLAAHMNYALQRVDEFEYILETQDFDVSDTPQVRDHKSVDTQREYTIYIHCLLLPNNTMHHPSFTGWCSGLVT